MFQLVGGNFQALAGATPVANGSVILTLSDPTAIIIATGGAAPTSYTLNLDANGQLLPGYTAYGNFELSVNGVPGTTVYHVNIYTGANGTGSLAYGPYDSRIGPAAPYAGTLYPDVTVFPLLSTNTVDGVAISGAALAGKVITAITPTTADWEFPYLALDNVAYSATPTLNLALGPFKAITLTGDAAPTVTNTGTPYGKLIVIEIIQDNVGGHNWTWPGNVFGGGVISKTANKKSFQMFILNGGNLFAISGVFTY